MRRSLCLKPQDRACARSNHPRFRIFIDGGWDAHFNRTKGPRFSKGGGGVMRMRLCPVVLAALHEKRPLYHEPFEALF